MKDWNKLLIHQSSRITDACTAMDSTGSDFLIVTDSHLQPLGILRDSAVRRHLLNSGSLDQSVLKIIDREFVSNQIGTSTWTGFEPDPNQTEDVVVLTGAESKVIGIRTRPAATGPLPNLVVLMVGGAGTRLRPLTEKCPKPLLPMHGKPLLERTIEQLSALGFNQFCMAVGYKADMIVNHFRDGSRWNVDITYVYEKERLGTCGAVRLLPQQPDRPFIVMNGDLVTSVKFDNLIRFHSASRAKATVCVHSYDVNIPYGVVAAEDDRLVSLKEKPTTRHWINAGIYVIDPSAISMIPEGRPYDMPTLLQDIRDNNERVSVYAIREKWIDIGSLEEYERASKEPLPTTIESAETAFTGTNELAQHR